MPRLLSTPLPNALRLGLITLAAIVSAGAALAPADAPAQTAPTVGAPKSAAAPVSGTPDDGIADFYFVPMRGQMGTDVHESIYEDVIKDIKKVKPDVVVYVLNCADFNQVEYLPDDDKWEASLPRLDQYRQLVQDLDQELSEFKQVMWVEDSVGFGSLVALAFPDLYMTSDARLGGLERIMGNVVGWKDPDVRAKMLAAWVGIVNGFLQQGGYPLEIGWAMVRPDKQLSVSFEGRKMKWHDNVSGHWVLDGSDKYTANFKAQICEDIGLCDGIADSKDDLAFLLGYREWRECPESEDICEDYVEDWRRTLEQTDKWARDYLDALRYAKGEDAAKYLGQAVSALDKIMKSMIKFPAVEIRWQQTRGQDRHRIQILIERLREQIRGLKPSKGDTGGTAPGGGPGLGGGGDRPRR